MLKMIKQLFGSQKVFGNTFVVLSLLIGLIGVGIYLVSQKTNLVTQVAAADLSISRSWKRWVIDETSKGADGARLRDVDKDGLLDIVAGWEQSEEVKVYLNPGGSRSKSPWPKIKIGRLAAVEDAFFADLDNDGAMDIVASSESPGDKITLFWGPKNRDDYDDPDAWSKEGLKPSEDKMKWMYGAAVQLDGKNGLDIIAGGKMGDAEIGWFESPSNPRNTGDWDYHKIGKIGWTMSIEMTDMDGDDDLDALVADRETGTEWFENPGRGSDQKSPWQVHYIDREEGSPGFLTLADLDKDGLKDVITAVGGHGITFSRRLSPSGRSWRNYNIKTGGVSVGVKGLDVADINKDGKNDIAFSGSEAKDGKTGVFWLSYRNSPKDSVWDAHEIETLSSGKFDIVSLLDLDNDGDVDFLTTEETANLGVVWWENPYNTDRALLNKIIPR